MEFQLASLWEALTDAGPDFECLVAGEQRRTRRQLDQRAAQLAHHLAASGVKPGDFVGIYSLNRAEFIEAMLGCWKIGAVAANINWRYVEGELRYVLDDADPTAMIVERKYVPLLDRIAPDQPRLRTYVVLEDETDHEPQNFGSISYEDALAGQPDHNKFDVDRSADDLYVLYTGGTTGMPKGVLWRHEDIFFGALGGGNYWEPIAEPEDIRRNASEPGLPMSPLALGPLMHGGGQWVTFIGLYSGGKSTVYTERSFEADTVLRLAEAERCETLAIIGDAMGRPLAEAKLAGDYDVSALVTIGSGGATLTQSVKDQLREAFPDVIITDGYGATETGSAATGIDNDNKIGEGLRFSIDDRTAVLDENLERVEPGSGVRGYLARTGHIPLGYHNDEVKTQETFVVDRDGTRWVVPGDFATVDEDGMLVLFGRGSVSINSGGEKIYPEEVEGACRSHPDVFDAIVIGVPDERFGASVCALVELRPNADELTLDQLQEHCRSLIAGYKTPRHVVIGPVQRTNVGKQDYVWAKRHAYESLGFELD